MLLSLVVTRFHTGHLLELVAGQKSSTLGGTNFFEHVFSGLHVRVHGLVGFEMSGRVHPLVFRGNFAHPRVDLIHKHVICVGLLQAEKAETRVVAGCGSADGVVYFLRVVQVGLETVAIRLDIVHVGRVLGQVRVEAFLDVGGVSLVRVHFICKYFRR